MSEHVDVNLIAPCGINCRTCVGFFGYTMTGQKRKKICMGCRIEKKRCAFIKKHCDKLAHKKLEYCFECSDFPCERLTTLDKRYTSTYGLSLIENLKYIQANGIESFLKNEKEKWKCPSCGKTLCVHTKKCYSCNYLMT